MSQTCITFSSFRGDLNLPHSMQIRVAVGMLVALVLVLLGPSMTEGLILTRCEMKQNLNPIFPANTSVNVTSEAAQIVCYAEAVSGLNTSKVSQWIKTAGNSTNVKPNKGQHHDSSENSGESKRRKPRSFFSKPKPSNKPDDHHVSKSTHQPHSAHTEPQKQNSTGNQPGHHDHDSGSKPEKGRKPRSISRPKPAPKPGKGDHGDKSPKPEPQKPNEATLYGIFQLPDWVACASGNKTTLNLCGLTCDKLIDDDITDDIVCLKTLMTKFMAIGSLSAKDKEHIMKLFDQVFPKQCASVDDALFFSACEMAP